MGSIASGDVTMLPVRLHGIELGRAVELIVDLDVRRVLGFEVRCGDDAHRFLPLAAARVHDGEIATGSSLTLLDELAFYRARGHGLAALCGARVANAGGEVGTGPEQVEGRRGHELPSHAADRAGRAPPRPSGDPP